MKQSSVIALILPLASNDGTGKPLFTLTECRAWAKKFRRMSIQFAREKRDELIAERKSQKAA